MVQYSRTDAEARPTVLHTTVRLYQVNGSWQEQEQLAWKRDRAELGRYGRLMLLVLSWSAVNFFTIAINLLGMVTPCPGNDNHARCCGGVVVACSLYDVQTGQRIGAIGRTCSFTT